MRVQQQTAPVGRADLQMQSFNGRDDNRNLKINGRSVLVIACSLLLFLVVFYIYVRRLCRYRGTVVDDGEEEDRTVITEQQQQRPIGIDKVSFESLPVRIHVMVEIGNDETATQCSICLSGLEEGDELKVIPVCKHGFHPECIEKWFKYHPSCPLCRVSLVSTVPTQ